MASIVNQLLGVLGQSARTVHEIATVTGLSSQQVSRACGVLASHQLARVEPDGSWTITPLGQRTITSKVPTTRDRDSLKARTWRALQICGRATVADLALRAARDEKTPEKQIHRYLMALERAGFIARLEKRLPGQNATGRIGWLLVRNTGPLAPLFRWRRNEVYDPNTGKTYSLQQEVNRGVVA